MMSDLYLGYRNGDANTPFGKFFKPEMAPLPKHVVEALQHGPQGGMALLAFDDAAGVADEGYQQTENGYGVLEHGGGSGGTAAIPAVTSCGIREHTFPPRGKTETRAPGVTSAAGR